MSNGPPPQSPSFVDPAALTFPARVTEVRPDGIVLSQTRFVPESPERQSDAGHVGDLAVSGVTRGPDGELVHHLADPGRLGAIGAGRQVRALIDGRRRANLSRLHSALHLVYFAYQATHGPTRRLRRRVDVVSAHIEVLHLGPEPDTTALAEWLRRAVANDLPIVHVQGGGPNRLHWVVDGVGSVPCAGPHPPSTGAIGPLAVTVEELDVDHITLAVALARSW